MIQTIFYLCGPIQGCTDKECKDWREYVKNRLKYPTLDPMARDYRGKEDTHSKEIVEGDIADIDRSYALIVNYIRPSVGTSMEIFYARSKHLHVYVVCAEDTVISPWLRYHTTAFFRSFDAVCSYLNGETSCS